MSFAIPTRCIHDDYCLCGLLPLIWDVEINRHSLFASELARVETKDKLIKIAAGYRVADFLH